MAIVLDVTAGRRLVMLGSNPQLSASRNDTSPELSQLRGRFLFTVSSCRAL
nr:MAG TPA_asm: hypothetical protein [Caudoviricetes sp.]